MVKRKYRHCRPSLRAPHILEIVVCEVVCRSRTSRSGAGHEFRSLRSSSLTPKNLLAPLRARKALKISQKEKATYISKIPFSTGPARVVRALYDVQNSRIRYVLPFTRMKGALLSYSMRGAIRMRACSVNLIRSSPACI